MLFLHPVFDVSAQGRCTITPINPTTLTAGGGVLAIGTENAMIQCNCTNDDSTVINEVRWYYFNGTRLIANTHSRYVAGTPYFRREPDDTNVVLVIPTFNDSYDGTYYCGEKVNRGPPGPPNAVVILTVGGKLANDLCSHIICLY